MFRSIRWRIAIPYVFLILIVMAFLVVYLSRFVRDVYLDSLRAQLTSEAHLIADALRPALAGAGADKNLDPAADHYARLLDARITIIGLDGTVLGESHQSRARMDERLDRAEVQQALRTGEGSSIRFSQTLNDEMIYAAVTVVSEGRMVGVVRIALPLSQVNARVRNLRTVMLVAALLTTLLAVTVSMLIAERTARPVRRLTQVAERMAEGDLNARFLLATGDEIGQLTRSFNRMADQLREKVTNLAAERSRLAAVLDNMAGGVIIADGEGRVRLINPAAARLLDTAPQEALGHSLAQVVRQHQLIELWQLCRERGDEQSAVVELGYQRLFLQSIVKPFTESGSQGYLLILQDLTQIRRLETIRRDFISNISHELRTPLAGLKALVDTLRDGAMEDPPAAQRFLDRMDVQVDALTQMVEELLELSRIESGRMPLRLKPTPVADLVLLPLERLEPQAGRAGLTIAVELDPKLPLVLADAERGERVITNLVHNAIKFTPPGGRVTVSARIVGEEMVVSVRDTGIGILPDDLPRIFERFYKADRARSGGGTGLGLAIAKHIVQVHGGRIWAESPWVHPGTGATEQGSAFHFSLLLAPKKESVV